MIIVGWGKNKKHLAYMGVNRCENCKNYSHFDLYEVVNKVKAYFITVAKYSKKYYLACSICDDAYEITKEQHEMLLKDSAKIPSKNIIEEILANTVEMINEYYSNNKIDEMNSDEIESTLEKIKNELMDKFKEDHVNYTIDIYIKALLDEDKPM